MVPMGGGPMMHPQYMPYGQMVPPGMHPGAMRPGPGQAYVIGPPRGAFPTGFPAAGGYVQMGAPGAPMMVPSGAMSAGQARPMAGGPPSNAYMYQPAPGAPQQPGGIRPIQGMRPITSGPQGGGMATIPGKGPSNSTSSTSAGTTPASAPPRQRASSAIKIVDPDTQTEIEMPAAKQAPSTSAAAPASDVPAPPDGPPPEAPSNSDAVVGGTVMVAAASSPSPDDAAAAGGAGGPGTARGRPGPGKAAPDDEAFAPQIQAETQAQKTVGVHAKEQAVPLPMDHDAAAVGIATKSSCEDSQSPKTMPSMPIGAPASTRATPAPEQAGGIGPEMFREVPITADRANAALAGLASSTCDHASAVTEAPGSSSVMEDDGDDDWETKDESELIIDKSVEPSKPPVIGVGGALSLRPGGGAIGTFSSATKLGPGAPATGKKCYDKEFLLQFAKFYTERPSSLPDMEILGVGSTDGPTKSMKGGGASSALPGLQGGPDEWRRVDNQRGGNRGGSDGLRGNARGAPQFNDPRAPGNNQYQKTPAGGKDGKRGKDGKQMGPRGFSNFDVKPLEETENAWKPAMKSKEEVDALEKLLRTTKGLLNKFTPEKFEKLTDQFLELEITCRTDMIAIIDLVFDKALFEPIFGFMYSQLCVRCAEKFPEFPDESNPDAKPHTFKRLLLNKCQEEFEKENVVEEELAKLPEETDPSVKEQIRKKAKNRMLGNIRFIGELYKCKMLTEKIMHECVIKLLGRDTKDPDLDEVECLVKLLTAIGKLIDHPKSKEYMDAYFARIRDMSLHSSLPNRVRFMLQEVIELRRGQWKERKVDPALRAASAASASAGVPMPSGRTATGTATGAGTGSDRIQQGHGDVRNEMTAGGRGGAGAPARSGSAPDRGGGSTLVSHQQQTTRTAASSGDDGHGRGSSRSGQQAHGAGAPPVVPLTEEQVLKKLEDNLEEFNQVGDPKELIACLHDLVPRAPIGRAESLGLTLIGIALPKACDARTDGPRDRLCEMFGALHGAKLVRCDEVEAFFRDALEFLEDEVVDVPHVAYYYARFLAHAIAVGLIQLSFLGPALEPLLEACLVKSDVAIAGKSGAAWMVVEIVRQLKAIEGDAGTKQLYEDAKLDLRTLLPADSRSDASVAALLSAGGIDFLDPNLTDSVKRAEDAANAEAAKVQISRLTDYLGSGILAPSAYSSAGIVSNPNYLCTVHLSNAILLNRRRCTPRVHNQVGRRECVSRGQR